MQLWRSSSSDRRSPPRAAEPAANSLALMRIENFPTVRARALLPLGDELGQIVLELGNRIDARIELLALEDWLEGAEDRERPLTQRAPFTLRYTEQIADELHRDRGGKIIDQVDDA